MIIEKTNRTSYQDLVGNKVSLACALIDVLNRLDSGYREPRIREFYDPLRESVLRPSEEALEGVERIVKNLRHELHEFGRANQDLDKDEIKEIMFEIKTLMYQKVLVFYHGF